MVAVREHSDGSVDLDRLWQALRAVEDPELPIGIIDLGLVRELDVAAGHVRVGMTYTSLACPCVEILKEDVCDAVTKLPDVIDVEVADVLEPWSRDDLTPEGVDMLRAVAVL